MSHEFKVLLDGIELPEDHVNQINKAVQQAVLHTVATLDVPGLVDIQLADGPQSTRLPPHKIWGIIICPKDDPCRPDLIHED